jgi:transcriptional regulator with XRE-family HTH domain
VDSAHVGIRIRALRDARQLTQKALASQVGCTHGLISQIESGLTCPSLDKIFRIAAALDVLPVALLDSPLCPTCGQALPHGPLA